MKLLALKQFSGTREFLPSAQVDALPLRRPLSPLQRRESSGSRTLGHEGGAFFAAHPAAQIRRIRRFRRSHRLRHRVQTGLTSLTSVFFFNRPSRYFKRLFCSSCTVLILGCIFSKQMNEKIATKTKLFLRHAIGNLLFSTLNIDPSPGTCCAC